MTQSETLEQNIAELQLYTVACYLKSNVVRPANTLDD